MKSDKSKLLEETVIPEMIAFKSIMRIRDIQLRKSNEHTKAKLKAERTGIPMEEEKEEADIMNMTEEEINAKKLEQEG
jgi:hypothetical protein